MAGNFNLVKPQKELTRQAYLAMSEAVLLLDKATYLLATSGLIIEWKESGDLEAALRKLTLDLSKEL